MADLSAFADAAVRAALAAQDVIQHYFARSLEVRLKDDASPVTVADEEAEQAIRAELQRAFPEHGIYGEEGGRQDGDSEYLWLVDPLDGTKSFVRGTPFVSTQIALWHRDRVIVGVSNAPLFEELAIAVRGEGATLNEVPVSVSDVNTLRNAHLSAGNIVSLARDASRWSGFGELVQRVNRFRGYGDFYHYHALASGKLDVVVESDVNILDIAALSLLVEEAGGSFTELDGGPVSLATSSVLASNGRLQAQAADILNRR